MSQKEFVSNVTGEVWHKENIKNWKKRLDNKDIYKVRELTEHLSKQFYSEKDW